MSGLAKANANALFVLGDSVNEGNPLQFDMLEKAVAGTSFPIYWVMGNHDYCHNVLNDDELEIQRSMFYRVSGCKIGEKLVHRYELAHGIRLVTINPERAFTDNCNIDFSKGATYAGYPLKAYEQLEHALTQNAPAGSVAQIVISHYPLDQKISNLHECDLLPDGEYQDDRMRHTLGSGKNVFFIAGHAHGDGPCASTPPPGHDHKHNFVSIHAGALFNDMQFLIMQINDGYIEYHMETIGKPAYESIRLKI